jgi:hypothetical protein
LQYINGSGHTQLSGFNDIAIDSSRGLYEIQNQPAYNGNAVRPVGSGPIYTLGGGYIDAFQLHNQLVIVEPEFYNQKISIHSRNSLRHNHHDVIINRKTCN